MAIYDAPERTRLRDQNLDSADDSWEDFDFELLPEALDPPFGSGLSNVPDADVLDLYADELERDENTFGGIYLSDEAMHRVFSILYGNTGYFIQISHAKAGESGKPGIHQDWSNSSFDKAQRQIAMIRDILRATLQEHDIPGDKHAEAVDRIIGIFQKRFSNEENRYYRTATKKRLGRAALQKSAA